LQLANAIKAIAVVLVLLTPTLAFAEAPILAEPICVKYGPCPLDVSSFTCTDTPRSSFVRRVCYDEPRSFMVIKLREPWYPYCGIDAATVQKLITAKSIGTFYNQAIRSRPDGSTVRSIVATTLCRTTNDG
jgi:hypothetical protein